MLESMPINVVGDVVQLPSLLGPINKGVTSHLDSSLCVEHSEESNGEPFGLLDLSRVQYGDR